MNIKYNGELCKVCGKNPAAIKGMCEKCYNISYCKNYYRTHTKLANEASGKSKKELRDEQSLNIIKDYATIDGITQSDLARKYGLSRQRVYQIIHRAGIKKS